MIQNKNASTTTQLNINQLYDQFCVLKNYFDSNKKAKLQKYNTPQKQFELQNQEDYNCNIIMATPQPKESLHHKQQNLNLSNLSESFQALHSAGQQKSITKAELIDQYYKLYQYSIKKVLKYKGKIPVKKHQIDSGSSQKIQQKENYQRQIIRKLNFEHNQTFNLQKMISSQIQVSNFQEKQTQKVDQNIQKKLISEAIPDFCAYLNLTLQDFNQRINKVNKNLIKIKKLIKQKISNVSFTSQFQKSSNQRIKCCTKHNQEP